ncbi:MAG: carbamoyl-phosphate synthase large subunit [Candidatus Scalindua sp. AMX11]|nr:MAG: carbamoyl-phosphate synthase large subunit [Candidatus Scalindua sp.]NOG84594.1 carbamoyl-phosphate synthase large subunit [Planctomycetota bacterium]RZV92368.1 MAG: carbamoyl-phosphate synthase large subunit [Candidatus Scalindua sp. SCAELEC01]TDE66107.1 MAG: carbamoyl-phosphate synthase large subunit [Candidatus Scalindua sp. AMX11]GJQ59080.1 MAG: carbamoyl-phosphate synthase (glutamine-hydrolyzing) [Candidatus Scalindua sp.]
MPKRTDIQKILIIGSGPIVIGQGCEFDYSGTQACRALKEEGYQIILVNSNPATIMTDPEVADKTYIEPMTVEVLSKIIQKERPDVLLPTLGGQTALNLTVSLAEEGVLDEFHVELIGAKLGAIKKAEDREQFKEAMQRIGLKVPESGYAHTLQEAKDIVKEIKFPVILRPSFTLGGIGSNVAYNKEELEEYVNFALEASPVHELLIEKSVLGWKEYELEVMRDLKDNVVIICSIENFDPMGIHTGDSITVAPAQTLTDKEYQIMRDASIKIIREIGVETGGSNIQFALNPENGEMTVIEMNPRVSRSSALASKATGFPIAKIAAKLAVGYTLDEIPNDITRYTPASFEPSIDYCVVKIPRFNFEKFPEANKTLTSHMKSIGEVMAIGRTFKEALGKATRSLEIGLYGFDEHLRLTDLNPTEKELLIKNHLLNPKNDRIWYVADSLRLGMSIEEIYKVTKIDRWFLYNMKQIVDLEEEIKNQRMSETSSSSLNDELIAPDLMRKAKEYGLSDCRLARLLQSKESSIREYRQANEIRPVFKMVDTCAAEFVAYTPYFYSTYETECEANPTNKRKIVILGSGPNRIGQGIEFDYCCVHCVMALREMGFETIMVNCNPETVSTDYDISDRLYFEPLTFEDVTEIIAKEKPEGVIVQFGGQTPLKLAVPLAESGVKILGTSPDDIDTAEDRKRFAALLSKLNLLQPDNGSANSFEEAKEIASSIGYPVLIRPSYVLGGRAMKIIFDEDELERYMSHAVDVSPEHPVLIDKFLEDAVEIDVDAVCDGEEVFIGGVMEHIEEAGVHSGDSACSLPPHSVQEKTIDEIKSQTKSLALELNVLGLINIQFAVKAETIFVLEVNPRASRTVPFVSKATGIQLAKVASQIIAGRKLRELKLNGKADLKHVAVKEAVFPFIRFQGTDTLLGPEMKSTGEVMGIDVDFGKAFAKSQMAIDGSLPLSGTVFISVRDKDKPPIVEIANKLHHSGFRLVATGGTARAIADKGIPVTTINKEYEGRPNIIDHLKNREVQLVINTAEGKLAQERSYNIRRYSIVSGIPYCTTLSGAIAAESAIKSMLTGGLDVKPIQEYHT